MKVVMTALTTKVKSVRSALSAPALPKAALLVLSFNLLSAVPAAAAIQSTFVYTKQNLTVVERETLDQRSAGKDDSPIEKMTLSFSFLQKRSGIEPMSPDQLDQVANDIATRLPTTFESAVNRSLQGLKFTKDQSADGRTVFRIQDSLTFYRRLIFEGSLEERVVANAILSD